MAGACENVDYLKQRIAVLERELSNANASNANLAREVRVLSSHAKLSEELRAENSWLRAELDTLRRQMPASPPQPAPAATANVTQLSPVQPTKFDQLRKELEALETNDAPDQSDGRYVHTTGWQACKADAPRPLADPFLAGPAAREETESEQVERLVAMAREDAVLDQKSDDDLDARFARLRGVK
jgi:hypothetical protein